MTIKSSHNIKYTHGVGSILPPREAYFDVSEASVQRLEEKNGELQVIPTLPSGREGTFFIQALNEAGKKELYLIKMNEASLIGLSREMFLAKEL